MWPLLIFVFHEFESNYLQTELFSPRYLSLFLLRNINNETNCASKSYVRVHICETKIIIESHLHFKLQGYFKLSKSDFPLKHHSFWEAGNSVS